MDSVQRFPSMLLLAVPFLALVGLLAGCSPHEVPVEPSVSVPAPELPTAAPAAEAVGLRTADEAELAELLRSHRGKVVLVDFWATWCLPCVELLPHTVELHERLAGRGLVVISVSFDEPESEAEVRRFLSQEGAVFDNLLSPYGVSSQAFEAFGIDDGGLPHIRIYSRAGEVEKVFGASGGAFSAADVEHAVQRLLDQP